MALPTFKTSGDRVKYFTSHPFAAKQNAGRWPAAVKAALMARQRTSKAAADAKGNDPNEFIKPMGLNQATKFATDTATTGADATYNPILRGVPVADQRTEDYYNQYKNELAGIQAHTQGLYDQAHAQQQQAVDSTSQLDQSQRQAQSDQMQKDAASRGATVSGAPDATAQQASTARRSLADSFGALIANRGANQGAYLGDKQRIATGAKVQAHQNLAQYARGVQKQRGEKIASTVATMLPQLRENERRFIEEQQVFGLNTQKAQDSAASAAANAQHQANQDKIASAKLSLDKLRTTSALNQASFNQWLGQQKLSQGDQKIAIDYYRAHHPGTGRAAKPAAPTKRDYGGRTTIQTMANGIRGWGQGKNSNQIWQGLQTSSDSRGNPYPDPVRRAAWEGYVYHRISGPTRRKLIDIGIKVPDAWTKPNGFPI